MMRSYLTTGFVATLLISACSDTLVYGERTGLNIAIRTDAPQGQPLEVNTGLQRRVVGYVPPRNPEGSEAVNMLSSFNLKRTPDSNNNPLLAKVTIETSFASGKAAVSAGGNNEAVQAIFERSGVAAPAARSDQQNSAKIRDWFISEPATTNAKALEYLNFLQRFGGTFESEGADLPRVYQAVSDGKNAALNAQFITLKKL
ncbi:hypothetical protein KX928_04765 [Roseobacter sp. YSTF-M11]|uniref:Lipoprotein n=1 Tax=Roseobacter insulae TaxID=2859783 RepID=A0A9X1FU33_9RHOB|nr:hypothetical protein [Roseobacter insulae]MBW4707095.1 hypothetical protein [Roseobacter insulae]